MMSRGDSELACLDCVRNNIIQKDCFGRVSLSNKQNWYGLHCDQDTKYDPILLAEFLTECKPNPAPSCFPDFVHQSGFIEHFRFSPSDTDNHGSKYITEKNKTQNMIQYSLIASNEERLENSTSKHPVGAIGRVVIFIPKQSYDSAFESFKRHWDKHIRSLEKYNGDKTIGVFLVECMESGLSMHENVYASIEKKTVHLGDLVKTPEVHHYLRLSRCPDFLDYMYKDRDKVKYVIHVCPEAIEVFRTDELMYVKKFIQFPYICNWCPGREEQYIMCVTQPD